MRYRYRHQARAAIKGAKKKCLIGVPIQALESTSEMAMTPIMHTIGVPIQALKSTSEMAMTPMGH